MKKIFLMLCLSILFLNFKGYSQCAPYDTNRPGIYPDTTLNLQPALVDEPYADVITAVIPEDTLVFGFRIPFDSVGIIEFNGLPTGFTYEPNSATNYWPGGASGCVKISGTANSNQTGTYPLSIKVRSYVGGLIQDNDVPGYKLVVNENSSGISKVSSTDELFIPNPFHSYSFILFMSEKKQKYLLSITDISGKQFFHAEYNLLKGNSAIAPSLKNIPAGFYIFSIINDQKRIVKRIYITD